MGRLPANQKHQPHRKRWKRFEKARPGHRLQMDVNFLERIPGTGKRLYQFTAIDDGTRIRGLRIYDACNYHRPHGALQGRTPYERVVEETRADVSQGSRDPTFFYWW